MLGSLDTDQLKTFIAIADLGSFTRASKEVHKTQSAVSMQMRRLEETVGKGLFEKVGRMNKLTSDGLRLLEYARRIAALNDEVMTVFSGPELVGQVRFGTPDDYAERFLPPILARFSRSHPLIEVEVICESSFALKDRIHRNEIDLAVATHVDLGNIGDVIRRERLIWIGPMMHKTHEREILPLALGPTSCSWRRSAIEVLEAQGRRHRVAYTSANSAALLAAVSSGLAITILPESAVWPELRILDESDGFPALPHCDIALLRREGNQKPHVTALAEHVIESLSNVPVNAMLQPQPHALNTAHG